MTTQRITMPYGNTLLNAEFQVGLTVETIEIRDAPAIAHPGKALQNMLESPVGMNAPAFRHLSPKSTVGIVVSDSFRRTGIHWVLPALLDSLFEAGVGEGSISFLVATGMHRPPTEPELMEILGDSVFRTFRNRVFVHNPEEEGQLVSLGDTLRGTPVWVNRRAVDSDFLIATGTVVLHYFAGFGGGRKSIVPGLAGMKTIAANHSLNLDPVENRLDPRVRIGALEGNPVAEDMAEASGMVRVGLCVNTVLNRHGEICGLHAGVMDAAHRNGCAQAAKMYTVPLREPADLVIASAGASKNFLQSHKALFNASLVMRPGGRILLLAPCPEGLGGGNFAEWLKLGTPDAVIGHLRRHAEINGQTALSTLARGPHTVMVSEMAPELVRLACATPAATFQEGVDRCLAELRAGGASQPTVCLMPSASHTVPLPCGG